MTVPKYAALAGRLLTRADNGGERGPRPEGRAATIVLAEGAIVRRYRRLVARRWSLAAAAVVLLGVGASRFLPSGPVAQVAPPAAPAVSVVGHASGDGVTVEDVGPPAPLAEGKALARGSRILAHAGGHATLSLSTGTELVVEDGGDLSIVDTNGDDQVFAIRAGAVRARVAKLQRGARFIIRTPDSEVEVRGTSFRVATVEADPACEGGTVTRVTVYEGVVSVRHSGQEARIAAGQNWPSGCVEVHEQPEQRLAKRPIGTSHQRMSSVGAPSTSGEPARAASDLGEQNDLFGRALAAKRSGATSEAIQGFEAFISRYPSSSLAESAFAQRMKLLRTIDRARAAAAAEQYLARYPHGFARADAEAIRRDAP